MFSIQKAKAVSLTIISVCVLSACANLDVADETAGWSAQKIYAEAKASADDGVYDRAIKLLTSLEARYPFGRYAQQAQWDTAYIQYKSGEFASALTSCERILRLHPNHPNIDYIFYLKGLVLFQEDRGLLAGLGNQDLSERDAKATQEAFDTFQTLVTRFPESRYAPDARSRMIYLVNSLAKHEAQVARYYYNRGAYVAAVNRAQAGIKSYPRSPAMEDSLYILMQSYEALNLPQQKEETERVLRQNFPQSRYLGGSGSGETKKSWWKIW